MEIKVLGSGCAKCKKTEDLIKQVLDEAKVEATVEKVSNLMEIAGYGVFGTPAVIIDGQVKCVGKIPTKKEILNWINS